MKTTTTLAVGSLIFVSLALFSGKAWAQHAHESPHGGQVRSMGDHHVEFLVVEGENNKGNIVVYLLDANLKPVSVDKVEGVVYLTLPDKSKQTLKLAASTEELKSHHGEEAEHEEEMHKEGKGEHHAGEEEHKKEGMHKEGEGEQHAGEGEHEKGKIHEGDKEKVSYFQAEVNLKGVDSFDAVVSLKIGDKRNNLRFKYVRAEHELEEEEEHKHK